jgi:hypothetical protein
MNVTVHAPGRLTRRLLWGGGLLLAPLLFVLAALAWVPGVAVADDNAHVLQAFAPQNDGASERVAVSDHTKRVVMFSMGIPLLVLLIATAVLGVAMGIYGKRVFVAHMVCAGLALTLSLAHAIVGVVWFYPF